MKEKKVIAIDDYCEKRIKPTLISGVKTEAILVFTRTALERIFEKYDKENTLPKRGTKENTAYIYENLRNLLMDLQKSVVNVEYLIELIQKAKKNPFCLDLKRVAKFEEPLITYNDTMAKRMKHHFPVQSDSIPEFLIICVLSNWFLEDEKSTTLYPFIEKYDFLSLIEKFEIYGQNESKEQVKLISKMQLVSIDIIDHLKKVKYKFNTSRISKKRKRK
jgi:hypothetical protein